MSTENLGVDKHSTSVKVKNGKLSLEPSPIISIKEARKILGKDSQRLEDMQVEKLVIDLDEVAKLHLGVQPEELTLHSTIRGGKGYSN